MNKREAIVEFLARVGDWASPGEIAAVVGGEPRHVVGPLATLARAGVIEARDTTKAESTVAYGAPPSRWPRVGRVYRVTS